MKSTRRTGKIPEYQADKPEVQVNMLQRSKTEIAPRFTGWRALQIAQYKGISSPRLQEIGYQMMAARAKEEPAYIDNCRHIGSLGLGYR